MQGEVKEMGLPSNLPLSTPESNGFNPVHSHLILLLPPPCSIYRLFIVANKIKWNPCYQQGRLRQTALVSCSRSPGGAPSTWIWRPQGPLPFERNHTPRTTNMISTPAPQGAGIRKPESQIGLRVVQLFFRKVVWKVTHTPEAFSYPVNFILTEM